MASEWYFQVMGEMVGPVSAAELKAKAERGTIGPDTLIRRSAEGKWVSASQVQGLVVKATQPIAAHEISAAVVPAKPQVNDAKRSAVMAVAPALDGKPSLPPPLPGSERDRTNRGPAPVAVGQAHEGPVSNKSTADTSDASRVATVARQRSPRFRALHIVASIFRISATLVVIVTLLVFVAYPLLEGRRPDAQLVGIGLFFGAAWAVSCFAIAELIQLAIDVAEDVREQRELLREIAYQRPR
ncbi:MAG: DUF4339 domain-containing protein [Planctomycetia bacterium]|nr:DUF4339 domain-containing protein [Planctomycetia bacterium]